MDSIARSLDKNGFHHLADEIDRNMIRTAQRFLDPNNAFNQSPSMISPTQNIDPSGGNSNILLNPNMPKGTPAQGESLTDLGSKIAFGDWNNPGGLARSVATRELLKYVEALLLKKYPSFYNLMKNKNAVGLEKWLQRGVNISREAIAFFAAGGMGSNESLVMNALASKIGAQIVSKATQDPEFLLVYKANPQLAQAITQETQLATQAASQADAALTQLAPAANAAATPAANATNTTNAAGDLKQQNWATSIAEDLNKTDNPEAQQAAIQRLQALKNNAELMNNPQAAQEIASLSAKAENLSNVAGELDKAAAAATKNSEVASVISNALAKISASMPALNALSKFTKYLPFIGLIMQVPEAYSWCQKIQGGEIDLANDAYTRAKFIGFFANFLGSISAIIPGLQPIAGALGVIGIGADQGAELAQFAGDTGGGLDILGKTVVPQSQQHKDIRDTNNMSLNTPMTPVVAQAVQEAVAMGKQGIKLRDALPQLRTKYPWLVGSVDGNPQFAQFAMNYNQQIQSYRSTSQAQPFVKKPTIQQWQTFLTNKGFPVAIDGIIGPETIAATKKYQASRSLAQTGSIEPNGTTGNTGTGTSPIDNPTIAKAKTEGFTF